jgi:DNA polymerase-3 subunit gamma/tau
MLGAISTLEPNFRKSGQQQMLVEMLLVRLALIDRTVSIEDLIKGMSGAGGEAASPAASRAAPKSAEPMRAAAPRMAAAPFEDETPDFTPPSVAQRPIERERSPEQLAKARDAMDRTAQSDTPQRITTEALKEERIGRLRKQDPALGAAIDALDLELLD